MVGYPINQPLASGKCLPGEKPCRVKGIDSGFPFGR